MSTLFETADLDLVFNLEELDQAPILPEGFASNVGGLAMLADIQIRIPEADIQVRIPEIVSTLVPPQSLYPKAAFNSSFDEAVAAFQSRV